jgi:heme ABC exporter ATP-binding subunit CcmA
MNKTTHCLEVRNLGFSYGQKKIFHKINFFLNNQETLQVKGLNGSGKTTLLEVVSGLRKKTFGQITWTSLTPTKQTKICFLPAENNGLFLDLCARDNLNFWAKLNNLSLSNNSIYTILESWGLSYHTINYHIAVKKFSTGMKRRLALARSFMSKAQTLVLDEPTNALDYQGRNVFIENLNIHLRQGGNAIIVTHDNNLLSSLDKKEIQLG